MERQNSIVEAFIYPYFGYGFSFSHLNVAVLHVIVFVYINIPKCSIMGFQNNFVTRLPQNTQISGQYLKFDEIYALLILALVKSLGIFLCGKELWFCNLLCDKYFVKDV